jgi:hypothetical protein
VIKIFKSLNIDYYKNGFNVGQVNCIDLPVAGAAGFYNYDNYFYYCFYTTLFLNWAGVGTKEWIKENPIERMNVVLNKLGLELKPNHVEDASQLIQSIKYHIDNKHPLIFFAFYKHLFFDRNYMNDVGGNLLHGILVNEYNTETSVIGTRDCTITRDEVQPEIKADALFRLRLTEDMVSDIWEKSNELLKKNGKFLFDTIFSMEKISEPNVSSYDQLIADFLNNMDFSKSKLADLIDKFEENVDALKNNMIAIRKDFHGSLSVLFSVFEMAFKFIGQDKKQYQDYFEFKNRYLSTRANILTKIQANALRGKSININERSMMTDQVNSLDSELVSLVSRLYTEKRKLQDSGYIKNYVFVDLSSVFNNEGFGSTLSQNCEADLTGKGEYFFARELPLEHDWVIDGMKFRFPDIKDGAYDNVSCGGQVVKVPAGYYKSIMLLECSEWGNYCEALEVEYEDGTKQEIKITTSDWSSLPGSEEVKAWSGNAAARLKDGVKLWDFTASIFATQYPLDKNRKTVSLKLPDCRNMHLFAITLGE